MYKYNFYSDKHLEELINKNKGKYIISIEYLKVGNFITFSDTPTIEILQQEQGNKISQLEEKINKLQNSINEMNLAILKG